MQHDADRRQEIDGRSCPRAVRRPARTEEKVTARRHFGSARKLPSGRYQAGYWHEGRRHNAPETFPAKAALAWLSVTEAIIVRGKWVDPNAGRVALEDYPTGG